MSADALARIQARGHIGIRLGLDRMRALLAELGDPQAELRGALVGGTNGKGSTAAMVEAVLRAAGYRTASSHSPHLESYRERITIDGAPIVLADLERVLATCLDASVAGEEAHGPATEFELLTAAAFLWAARQHADVVVFEVGLGGRLDATNAWDPDVAAITNVGLDHRDYLGDTLAEVAAEKAAIIKTGARAVTAATGEALEVIRSRAAEQRVPLTLCRPLRVEGMGRGGLVLEHERLGRLDLPLLGRHQAENAAVAVATIEALSQGGVVDADDDAIRRGLAVVRWPGRLEFAVVDGIEVIFDGAHNPGGAIALAGTIDELAAGWHGRRLTLLLGALRDKDVSGLLEALATSTALRTGALVASGVADTDRSMLAAELAAAWSAVPGATPAVAALDDADAAIDAALATARSQRGPLLIAGSLYLVGHARQRLLAATT